MTSRVRPAAGAVRAAGRTGPRPPGPCHGAQLLRIADLPFTGPLNDGSETLHNRTG